VIDYRDSREYLTYHGQWNKLYWCSYGHEHGSDPAIFGSVIYPNGTLKSQLQLSMGYIAYYNNRQNEPDIGFKGYAIKGETINMYFVVHSTTSSLRRACARFHTLMAYGVDKTSGDLLFEMGYKADFGSGMARKSQTFLQVPGCDQSEVFPGCKGSECFVRKLRVLAEEDKGYEVWRGGDNFVNLFNAPQNQTLNPLLPLPLELTNFEIDIRNPITGCSDSTCKEKYYTKGDGMKRTIQFKTVRVKYECDLDADGDGYFVTDQYGFFLRDINLASCKQQNGGGCEVANEELLQYVKPGVNVYERGEKYFPKDSWSMLYSTGNDGIVASSISDALERGAATDCPCADGLNECVCYTN
jgi:hypothetical protein